MEEKAKKIKLFEYVIGQLLLDRSRHILHGELEDAGWNQGIIAEAFAMASYSKRFLMHGTEEEIKTMEQSFDEYKKLPMPYPEK